MELKLMYYSIRNFFRELLIVPYGIEMFLVQFVLKTRYLLLIVPYGIEIMLEIAGLDAEAPFNRTLWN